MSDQNDIDMDTGDAGVSDGSAKGRSGFLLQLLKWIAISLGALIFIVTVVVITVNIMGLTGRPATSAPVSEDYVPLQEPLEWYVLLIAVIGGVLFHELWEAKSRYVFPYFVMMIPMAADGLAKLAGCLGRWRTKDEASESG